MELDLFRLEFQPVPFFLLFSFSKPNHTQTFAMEVEIEPPPLLEPAPPLPGFVTFVVFLASSFFFLHRHFLQRFVAACCCLSSVVFCFILVWFMGYGTRAFYSIVFKPGPNQTVRSDRVNREPLLIEVLLTIRTLSYEKSTEPLEPQSDCTVLRTMADFHGLHDSFFF